MATKVMKAAKAVKVAKKAPVARKTSAAAAPVMKPVADAMNRTALVAHLSSHSGVEPKAVKAVLAALNETMTKSFGKKAGGKFVLPGLLKVEAVKVPAKPARKGINPFTKEPTTFKAKPASVKVKVRALKSLKDAAMA